jgi:hypothetical protein
VPGLCLAAAELEPDGTTLLQLAMPDIRKQIDTISSPLSIPSSVYEPSVLGCKADCWAQASMQSLPDQQYTTSVIESVPSQALPCLQGVTSLAFSRDGSQLLSFELRRDRPRARAEVGEDAQGVPWAHQLRQSRHLQRRWLESRHGVYRWDSEGEVVLGLNW